MFEQWNFNFSIFMSSNKLLLKSLLNLKGNANSLVEEYGNFMLSNFYHTNLKVVFSKKIYCISHNNFCYFIIIKSLYSLCNVPIYWERQIIQNRLDQALCTVNFLILVLIFIGYFFLIQLFKYLISIFPLNFSNPLFIQ